MKTPKIGFISLGCPKALVDSERILTKLRSEGYEVAPDYDALNWYKDYVVAANAYAPH
jgi:tRNA A37 methylthiotransferase MiaB